jgi:hypothetical protein
MSSASGVQRRRFVASSGTLPVRLAIGERQRPQPSPPCVRPSASRAALRFVDGVCRICAKQQNTIFALKLRRRIQKDDWTWHKPAVCKLALMEIELLLQMMEDQMSLRLQSVSIDRQAQPQRVLVGLSSSKGESISVQVPIESGHDIEKLTLHEIEKLALGEAKKFFSQST